MTPFDLAQYIANLSEVAKHTHDHAHQQIIQNEMDLMIKALIVKLIGMGSDELRKL